MSGDPIRCGWRGLAGDPLYEAYHDTDWGVPEYDSRALWEKLVLDGFQAGLSWITILRKREAFREAFAGFDPEIVARFGEAQGYKFVGPVIVYAFMQAVGMVNDHLTCCFRHSEVAAMSP